MTYREKAWEICKQVHEAKDGCECKKFTGAVMVEVIREHLLSHGLNVSARDVFIKGLPIEIDLLVVKSGAEPQYGILYDQRDVLAVLEIKSLGSFGQGTVESVKKFFDRTKAHFGQSPVYCAYLTLSETAGFKWRVQPENNGGCDTFTMFWQQRSKDISETDVSDDWEKLVAKLCELTKTAL